MYKSKTWKELQAEQGITRTGAGAGNTKAQARMQKTAAMNGRWNKGQLPKGSVKGKHIIGQQNTGR